MILRSDWLRACRTARRRGALPVDLRTLSAAYRSVTDRVVWPDAEIHPVADWLDGE